MLTNSFILELRFIQFLGNVGRSVLLLFSLRSSGRGAIERLVRKGRLLRRVVSTPGSRRAGSRLLERVGLEPVDLRLSLGYVLEVGSVSHSREGTL